MSRLELRIPPDVVWVLVAALMWVASVSTPHVAVPATLRTVIAATATIAGVLLMASARAALTDAETTWHPTTPEQTTSLVSTGVYGMSRNPIYLGMLLVMVGWAVLLSSPAALLLSAVFVVYLDRFQIGPEERALSSAIGQPYLDYARRVRRWL